jgi:hypothetical protein
VARAPRGTEDVRYILRALTLIGHLGEPEAAVEILSRHVEDVERTVVAPNFMWQVLHLSPGLAAAAAWKFEGTRGRGAPMWRRPRG